MPQMVLCLHVKQSCQHNACQDWHFRLNGHVTKSKVASFVILKVCCQKPWAETTTFNSKTVPRQAVRLMTPNAKDTAIDLLRKMTASVLLQKIAQTVRPACSNVVATFDRQDPQHFDHEISCTYEGQASSIQAPFPCHPNSDGNSQCNCSLVCWHKELHDGHFSRPP